MLTKTKNATRRNVSLLEYTSAAGRVDTAHSVIRGVRIIGKVSQNNREYTDAALRQAVPLYEGSRVFLDHPPADRPNAARSLKDWVGVLENVRLDGECVRGDLRLIGSHPMAPAILESARDHSQRFGLSHNAAGETVRRGGRVIVETITSVRSVDLVDRPATNSGLFESVGHPASMTFSELRKEISMLNKRLDRPARRTLREMDSLDHPATPDDAVASPGVDWDDIQQQVATIIGDDTLSDRQRLDCLHDLVHQHDAVPTLAESCSDVGTVEFSGGQTVGRGPRPRPVPQQTSAESTRRQAAFLKSIGAKPAR